MFYAREDIINASDKTFLPYKDSESKTREDKSEEKSEEESKEYINNTFNFIEGKSKDINNDSFLKYFNFLKPFDFAKKLYETKDAKENSELEKEIKNRWGNLKDETKKMSVEEIENEKRNQILKTVNKILDFNKEIKKKTPDQMLSRLPISLVQLK